MSKRDDTVPMRHMLDHAREAVVMARGRVRGDLDTDRMLQLAITRILEIVGEAASRVTGPGRERYPGIPWQDVVDTRNRIVHGYDTVNYDIVWRIITDELPTLIAALERALPGHRS
ncbi:MAG: DUF86 domain-containing protein [Candidatus Rokubacteria bacterium]|nr:DUF86 domain-containing protein [Candidatus Rokubacteria bacterium]